MNDNGFQLAAKIGDFFSVVKATQCNIEYMAIHVYTVIHHYTGLYITTNDAPLSNTCVHSYPPLHWAIHYNK